MWKTALGLEVTLENQDFATLQDNRTKGNYEISRHGWLGDYVDPMTFLDMWVSNSGQNDAKYNNPKYDELIKTAKDSFDQKVRMDAMHEAEKTIMADLPIIPIYHYTNQYLDNGKVKDTVHDTLLGNLIFTWATSESKTVNYGIGEIKTIDPQLNNDTSGANVVQQTFEGLTAKDKTGAIVPGVAEKWDVSEDGLTWTFHLRDAKWSDGKPVVAGDFVYAWQRAVDPASECEYAYQVWYVKNGQKITNGEMKPEELGVVAKDDKTLVVTLEGPTNYFTQLTAFPTLSPVRKDIIEKYKEKWATNPESYVVNGPRKVSKFDLNSELVMVKNDTYWNAANVSDLTLNYKLGNDDAAFLAAFEAGELDISESFPPAETQRMKDAGFYQLKATMGTYFYVINMNSDIEALKDLNFRKALSFAIDRLSVIDVAQNSAIPAKGFVPPGVPDADGSDFQANAGNLIGITDDYAADCKTARQLLRDAGYNVTVAD